MYSIINKEMLKAREKGLHISSPEMKGAVTAAIFAVAVFAIFFEYRCPILAVTAVPASAAARRTLCGSCWRGHFAAAFRCHGMFWCFPLLWLYFCFDFRLLKDKRCNDGALAAILAGYLLEYCVRVLL